MCGSNLIDFTVSCESQVTTDYFSQLHVGRNWEFSKSQCRHNWDLHVDHNYTPIHDWDFFQVACGVGTELAFMCNLVAFFVFSCCIWDMSCNQVETVSLFRVFSWVFSWIFQHNCENRSYNHVATVSCGVFLLIFNLGAIVINELLCRCNFSLQVST
jgi:hypothetical protein